jgi:hypothetical protein
MQPGGVAVDGRTTLRVPEIRPPTLTCRFATHPGSA